MDQLPRVRTKPLQIPFIFFLKEFYGKVDLEAVAKVKEVYKTLQLQKVFTDYEDEAYDDIVNQINQLSEKSMLNPDIFYSFLGRIYKRTS